MTHSFIQVKPIRNNDKDLNQFDSIKINWDWKIPVPGTDIDADYWNHIFDNNDINTNYQLYPVTKHIICDNTVTRKYNIINFYRYKYIQLVNN